MLNNVANDELTKIDSLYQRWLLGGSAADITAQCLPESWNIDTKKLTQAELRRRALILGSQQRTWLLKKELTPDQSIIKEAPLPKLALPIIDESLRPIFRDCLLYFNNTFNGRYSRASVRHLIDFIYSRGHIVHPADWLPNPVQLTYIEPIYLPWARSVQLNGVHPTEKILSEHTWYDIITRDRPEYLRYLRYNLPKEARELIQTCLEKESTNQQVKLINCLDTNLSVDDLPFLESLITKERPKKVVTKALELIRELLTELDTSKLLTQETWGDFSPRLRLEYLISLRNSHATKARELIQACITKESPTIQAEIIGTLKTNLSADDQPYLESLMNSRSKKVVNLAQDLLEELNHNLTNSEDIAQYQSEDTQEYIEADTRENVKIAALAKLVEVYQVTESSSSNHPLKVERKQSSAHDGIPSDRWLDQVSLDAFAEALSIDLPTLVTSWCVHANPEEDTEAFLSNAMQHLSGELIYLLTNNIIENSTKKFNRETGTWSQRAPGNILGYITSLLQELDQAKQEELKLKILKNMLFEDCFWISLALGEPLPPIDWAFLQTTDGWADIKHQIGSMADDTRNGGRNRGVMNIAILGLILPPECAQEALNQLIDFGVHKILWADRILSILKLNAQLPNKA